MKPNPCILLSLALGIFLLPLSASAESAKKPNILFIAIDDLNDWTGFLGGHPQAKTPHMDALAARGVSFSNAQTASPACSPSRNALLLGQHPYTTGLYPFYDYHGLYNGPLKNAITLPAHFKKNGFDTYGSGKIAHGSENSLPPASLDEWTGHHFGRKLPKLIYDLEKGYEESDGEAAKMSFCPATNPLADYPDYDTALYGLDILKRPHDKPFFLALGFNKPHLPCVCPQKYFDLYAGPITPPPIKNDDLVDVPWAARSNANLRQEMIIRNDDAWEKVRRAYLACISFTDDNIGIVLDALAKSPYADNTIIVLWSDHGFHLGSKRTFTKFTLWQEADRVPFIIYDPRNKPSAHTCAAPVSLVDIFPTLCQLTDIPLKKDLDGESLVPWLKDPTLPKSTPAIVTWGRGNYSICLREWRYNRYFDGSEELYNLKTDPNEWINLAGNKEFADQKKELAVFLPKKEAPQVKEAIALYNVVDADRPSLANFKKLWQKAEKELKPPLD